MQSNLSIADMLYNRRLVIAETVLRNRPNNGQTLIENLYIADIFIADICFSGHFFWTPLEHFGQNYLLRANTLKTHVCFYLTHFFILTWSSSSDFSKLFFTHVIILTSPLTLSRQRSLSYRNQSTDLQSKSMDWFLYDNGPRLERIKKTFTGISSPNPTPQWTLCPVTSKWMWWFANWRN